MVLPIGTNDRNYDAELDHFQDELHGVEPMIGVCKGCSQEKELARYQKVKGGKFYFRPVCVSCWSAERNSYQAAYRAKHSERLKVADKIKYHRNPEYQAAIRKRHYEKWKKVVFDHYGAECACCGETEPAFLAIDHKENNGNQHRKKVGIGVVFYRWIVLNNFPNDLQILCSNCNHGKHRNGGACPHEKARSNYMKPSERYEPSNWIIGI